MSALLAILLVLPLVAAQGAVVFGTAWLLWKRFELQSDWWKPALMAISWLFWIIITLGGYIAIGGEGGIMDGMGMMLMLCFSCLVSSFVFTIVWVALPKRKVDADG